MSRAQQSGLAALFHDYREFAGERLWLLLALMILGALAEGFGLLMIVPVATIAIGSADDNIFRYAPWVAAWPREQRLFISVAMFVAAMAARSLLLYLRDVRLVQVQSEYEADLSARAANTLASRGWPFASRMGQAGMQSLLLNDVPRAAEAAGNLQSIAAGATMLLVQLALTFVLSPRLTAVALVCIAAAFLLSLRLARRSVRSGFAISEAQEESAGSGFRLQAGLKGALAQGTTGAFLDEYRSNLRQNASQFTDFARHLTSSRQLATFGAALAAAALLLIGVLVLKLPFPILVASLVLFARMSAPTQLLQANVLRTSAFASSFGAIERRLGKLERHAQPFAPAEPARWQLLKLENLSFAHPSGRGIEQASLELPRGHWLGIEGASASGKTTLVDLIAGLLEPRDGFIFLDGQSLAGPTLDHWRAAIAYVGQEGSIFSDTVRGNLLAEGARADDVELWQALEAVGLGSRVRALPAGLNEPVGERGSQLSGGERQRLVLARALLRRPTLLILDEATSALDADGEAALMARLKAADQRPAAIVIAHRPSTLRHCDSVISIQHGRVSRTAMRRSATEMT